MAEQLDTCHPPLLASPPSGCGTIACPALLTGRRDPGFVFGGCCVSSEGQSGPVWIVVKRGAAAVEVPRFSARDHTQAGVSPSFADFAHVVC